MKYAYRPLILIFIFYCAQAEQHTPSGSKNNKLLALQQQLQQNPGRSATAAASIGLGTYWLVDTIKTAIDTQNQPNTEKGTCLNAAVAAGLISFGGYLLKPIIWDQNKSDKNDN